MPLERIGLMAGRSEQLAAIGAGVQRAMVECLDVPVRDQSQMVTEHPTGRLIYNSGYLSIERTDGIVIGQILLSRALGGAQAGVLCARGGIDRSGGDSSPGGRDDHAPGKCARTGPSAVAKRNTLPCLESDGMSFVRGVMQEKIMEPIQSSTTKEAAAQTLRDYLQAFRSLRPSAVVSYFHLPFVLIADGAVGALAGAISLDAFPG